MGIPRHPAAATIAVVGLVCLVFGRIVAHDWVEFDDLLHIVENPSLAPVTWRSLVGFWTQGYEHLYIPVSYTLFAVEAVAARWLAAAAPTAAPAPWLFHLMSVAMHVAATLVVRRILVQRCGSPWAAAAGAAMFAIHPLQVESVAWISEQRGLLSGLLALLAVDRFLEWSEKRAEGTASWREYAVGLAAFILALLAKPTSVVTPLVALLLSRDRLTSSRTTTLAALAPWFACAVAVGIFTRVVQPADLTSATVSPVGRLLIAADTIAFYAARLVMPWNLCVAYGRTPQVALADPATPWVAAGVAAAIAAIAVLPQLRSWRLPTALFLVPLAPVLGLVPFVFQNQSTVADRYVYLSMLGPAVAVAGWLGAVAATDRLRRLVAAAGIACLAALAWRQAGFWRDTGTLAAHAVAVAPGVTGSWTLLSAHRLVEGDPRSAIESARRAIAIAPQNRIAWLNLAAGHARLRNAAAANDAFMRLHRLGMTDDDIATIFYNRGCTSLGDGHAAAAAADFRLALDRDRRHPRAATNLGVALTRLGDLDEAIGVFRARLAVEPRDGAAWVGLGNAFFAQGRHGEAVECYGAALDIEPNDPPTLQNRAAARLETGDMRGAADDAAAAAALGALPDFRLQRLLDGAAAPR
jgi:tetratricopeptide (TPR) repeat protein